MLNKIYVEVLYLYIPNSYKRYQHIAIKIDKNSVTLRRYQNHKADKFKNLISVPKERQTSFHQIEILFMSYYDTSLLVQ